MRTQLAGVTLKNVNKLSRLCANPIRRFTSPEFAVALQIANRENPKLVSSILHDLVKLERQSDPPLHDLVKLERQSDPPSRLSQTARLAYLTGLLTMALCVANVDSLDMKFQELLEPLELNKLDFEIDEPGDPSDYKDSYDDDDESAQGDFPTSR